eukprot:7873119-Alexandrium_andersonii.AAC.1
MPSPTTSACVRSWGAWGASGNESECETCARTCAPTASDHCPACWHCASPHDRRRRRCLGLEL